MANNVNDASNIVLSGLSIRGIVSGGCAMLLVKLSGFGKDYD